MTIWIHNPGNNILIASFLTPGRIKLREGRCGGPESKTLFQPIFFKITNIVRGTWRWEAGAYRQKVRQTPRCSSGRRESENAPFPVSRYHCPPLTDCRWAAHSYARRNSWTLCSLKWPLIQKHENIIKQNNKRCGSRIDSDTDGSHDLYLESGVPKKKRKKTQDHWWCLRKAKLRLFSSLKSFI